MRDGTQSHRHRWRRWAGDRWVTERSITLAGVSAGALASFAAAYGVPASAEIQVAEYDEDGPVPVLVWQEEDG